MRKLIFMVAALVSGAAFAQDVTPKLEAEGDMVKATYYNDEGNIAQQGYFKDGKPEGKWVMYDANGKTSATGEYAAGKKTGKWFFWSGSVISEVDYSESRIASVKSHKRDALVVRE